MNTQLDFAYMMSEQSVTNRQCGTSSWNDHVQTLIDTLLSGYFIIYELQKSKVHIFHIFET